MGMGQWLIEKFFAIGNIFGIGNIGEIFELCVFLLVLNLDTFLTGLSFGVVGIRISGWARLLVGGCSGIFFGIAMFCGERLNEAIPVAALQSMASIVLLVCTLLLVMKYCGLGAGERLKKADAYNIKDIKNINNIKDDKSRLNDIWQRPAKSDSNADKSISLAEALLPGMALALDTLPGGVALGILQEQTFIGAILSGFICWAMLRVANELGLYTSKNIRPKI